MGNWSQSYRRLDNPADKSSQSEAWHSPALLDPPWDDFLRRVDCGQYQQSSLWAEFKAGEGWRHHRVIVTRGSDIVGGFQILWKKKGPWRIGYVSKGPAAHSAAPNLAITLRQLLVAATRELRLDALILQPPDETPAEAAAYAHAGFVQSNPLAVIEATYVVDLNADMETLLTRMSASMRRNLRKALKRPSTVRAGSEQDLGIFFALMSATCRRQETRPNPSSEDAIRLLWRIFSPHESVRVTLVECEGQVPAAKLSLCFGDRLTVWKKGWNGGQGDWHPNELLEHEALSWARSKGCRLCDFCSFDREAAERILAGEPATSLRLSSRDEYHMRFGGRPMLLPRAQILIPNPLMRWLYRQTYVRFEHRKVHPLPSVRT
jgi:hypothetical protein